MPRLTLFEQATPATADVNDPGPVVLGVRFNSSVAGKITGIRFYKAAANTGPHTVALWDTSGVVLAQATATSETASGWQEVLFTTPVSIAANTDYVAGYLAPKGHYSVTGGGFAAAVTNGPLTAVADGSKSNGLYTYSSTLTFPNSSLRLLQLLRRRTLHPMRPAMKSLRNQILFLAARLRGGRPGGRLRRRRQLLGGTSANAGGGTDRTSPPPRRSSPRPPPPSPRAPKAASTHAQVKAEDPVSEGAGGGHDRTPEHSDWEGQRRDPDRPGRSRSSRASW